MDVPKCNPSDTTSGGAANINDDGTNNDDLSDYRPGTKAGDLYQIQRPFVELKITKEL